MRPDTSFILPLLARISLVLSVIMTDPESGKFGGKGWNKEGGKRREV
jgi:hypothetical protein